MTDRIDIDKSERMCAISNPLRYGQCADAMHVSVYEHARTALPIALEELRHLRREAEDLRHQLSRLRKTWNFFDWSQTDWGLTNTKIAQTMGVSQTTVAKARKRAGVGRVLTPLQTMLLDNWESNETSKQLADRLGCRAGTVSTFRRRAYKWPQRMEQKRSRPRSSEGGSGRLNGG